MIREGMNKVLDGKLDAISYLPLKDIIGRISGKESYTVADLRSITKVSPKEDADEEKIQLIEV